MWSRMFRSTVVAVLLLAAHSVPAAAQLGSRPAEEWIKTLDAPERIAGLKVDEIITRLQLKPGDVVADLGAGSGVFSLPMARAVAPSGKVYAVDVDQAFIDYIKQKVKDQQMSNVHPILGRFRDPALPAADVDVAFMHDVLHHIEDRAAYLKQVTRYLKPGGRIALVEFDGPKGPHRDNPELQVTLDELNAWMADVGFFKSAEYPLSDDKYYVVYSRK